MRLVALALIVSLFTLGAADAFAQEATSWRKVADAIPLGSKVKVRTTDDKRISGTLMRVDDSSVMVKRNARMPEPGITVTFDRVVDLQRDHGGGFSWAKAIGLGLGIGAGAIVTMVVIALQISD